MSEDVREPWDSERWVIDRLVEAVDAGDTDGKQRLVKRLFHGYAEDGWHLRHVVDAGAILTNEMLDISLADRAEVVAVLEGTDISDARLKKLSRGGQLTESEIAAWQEYLNERAFDPELMFLGRANMCVVLEVKHSSHRRAHLAIMNWDGHSGVLVAAYATYTEVMTALRNAGKVRMDDVFTWQERRKSESQR